MNNQLEFLVAGIVEGVGATVIGFCGGEKAIEVGDRFNAVYRYPTPINPRDLERIPARQQEEAVDLRVVAIRSHNRDFPILGRGSTGSLRLEGHGIEKVGPGKLLGVLSHATVTTGEDEPHRDSILSALAPSLPSPKDA